MYIKEEMVHMSVWALQAFGPSKAHIHIGICNCAMILLLTNTAFWGDSTWHLLWSDLFKLNLPMVTIGPEAELPVHFNFYIDAYQKPMVSFWHLDRHLWSLLTRQKPIVLAVLMNMASFSISMQSYVTSVALHFVSSATFTFCAKFCHSFHPILLITTMVNTADVTGTNCWGRTM